MRALCVYFPRLPVQLALLRRPQLAGRDLVLVDGAGDDALVTAFSAGPAREGVVAGMTAADARRHCPVAAFVPDAITASLDILESAAARIRGRVTPFVEIGGRDHLFAGLSVPVEDERALAGSVRTLLAGWTGLELRVGIGSDRASALAAARCARAGVAVDERPATARPDSIAAWRDDSLSATATVQASGDARLIARRLCALLAARGEGFRVARLERDGASPLVLRSREPIYDRPALEEWAAEAAGTGRITLTVSGLVPDLRAQPYTLPARRSSRPVAPDRDAPVRLHAALKAAS